MKVERIMTRDVCVCASDDRLNAAAQKMWESDCGCTPVIDTDGSGQIIGMLTDRDICMAAYTQGMSLAQIPVSAAMAHKVITCSPGDDLGHAEALMRESRIRRLPVLDDNGRLVGIISLNDIAREAETERRTGVNEVSGQEVVETLAMVSQPRHGGHAAFKAPAFIA